VKNEHEDSKENPEKGNLFCNVRNIFAKTIAQKYIREK